MGSRERCWLHAWPLTSPRYYLLPIVSISLYQLVGPVTPLTQSLNPPSLLVLLHLGERDWKKEEEEGEEEEEEEGEEEEGEEEEEEEDGEEEEEGEEEEGEEEEGEEEEGEREREERREGG
ncbi:hypothetical protein Pmani_033083 [Petrolisthes manimaculis]|uniref:Uncharacterized protein n=1 Tax=Petrolisthes manimaculis TaxID=1843537 RepID=A0AAE1NRP0_9EUCA|nr:hypothetical protein Pmani_033083 [Petrolisthes manimaculis]